DLDDLAARRDDLAGRSVDHRLAPVIRSVGLEHEHEFVAAHAPGLLPVGNAPLTADRTSRSRKETPDSLARGGWSPICSGADRHARVTARDRDRRPRAREYRPAPRD